MKKVIAAALVVASGIVAGCAHGMAGSPMRYCTVTQGYAKGTNEYRSCMKEQLANLRDRGDAQKEQLLRVVAAGAAGYAEGVSETRPVIIQTSPAPPNARQRLIPAKPANPQMSLCPDGTYVAGTRCVLTPAGTYVGTSL